MFLYNKYTLSNLSHWNSTFAVSFIYKEFWWKEWGTVENHTIYPFLCLFHYQKTGENQQNYQRKYFVGNNYRRTKFYLKICRYIPTVSPTDYTFCLERCNGVVTWSFFRRFYRRNDWGIQTEIVVQWHGTVTDRITDGITDGMYPSGIPSVKTIIYTPSADTLFLCFSFFFFPIPPLPSQTATNHLSQLSTILNTSTQVSYTLYVVTISVSCGFYHFFVSNSILFSFNI